MADQIERMEIKIENQEKVLHFSLASFILGQNMVLIIATYYYFFYLLNKQQYEELQTKFNARVQECSDLSNKLNSTQVKCY